jgi:hypothetical protein
MTSRSPKSRRKGGAHPSYYSPLLDGSQVAKSGQPGPDGPADDGNEVARQGIQAEMHAATRDWVGGRMSTKKHAAVHARGKKVLREMRK